jgi:hypothetical protein
MGRRSANRKLCFSQNHFHVSHPCHGRGKFFYLFFGASGDLNTYALPINPARGIPGFPPGGLHSAADLKVEKGLIVIPQQIDSAVAPNHYSYTRENTRRNIYRIPLPE